MGFFESDYAGVTHAGHHSRSSHYQSTINLSSSFDLFESFLIHEISFSSSSQSHAGDLDPLPSHASTKTSQRLLVG